MSDAAATRSLRVRVLGAGVAGLAAAGLLARRGHEIEIVDEAFAVPAVGTALGLFGPAQRVLAELGLLEDVRARAAAPRSGRLVGADGRTLAQLPAGGALLIPRSELVRLLLDALPDQVARRTARIADVRPLREGADLLVGADGVHSLVRASGWPGRGRARSHGVTILRGTAEIPPPEVSETWGGGWLFGITPLPGERTNWFAVIPEHRSPTVAMALTHLRGVLGGRRAPIDRVLEAALPETTLVHGMHTAPPMPWPVRENVVLIGDAAHAMAPNLGHGANTALVDATALAASLARHADLRRALRDYAARRGAAGQAWRLGSAAMASLALTHRAAPARDRLLRTLGALSPASAPGS